MKVEISGGGHRADRSRGLEKYQELHVSGNFWDANLLCHGYD
jgi:hypothetical protein